MTTGSALSAANGSRSASRHARRRRRSVRSSSAGRPSRGFTARGAVTNRRRPGRAAPHGRQANRWARARTRCRPPGALGSLMQRWSRGCAPAEVRERAHPGDEHVEGGRVHAAVGDDDVGVALRRLDELQVHGPDGRQVLVDDAGRRAAAIGDVALEAPDEADVGIGVDVDLEVEQLAQAGLEEHEDALDDDDRTRTPPWSPPPCGGGRRSRRRARAPAGRRAGRRGGPSAAASRRRPGGRS